MLPLIHLLQSLLARALFRRDTDEAYLAGSVDMPDLERRMRTLDERDGNPEGAIAFGLYAR